jgi:hypothetical protein
MLRTPQDFLQVLSMFANFGFEWPPAVKALYNVFSLLNFNFELLAPECSVSINFEAKWCVGVCAYGRVWSPHCFSTADARDRTQSS